MIKGQFLKENEKLPFFYIKLLSYDIKKLLKKRLICAIFK